eukprot:TRINITY_DN1078_c0_g1_i1.p1 TRINITY_DN1078_c0_g1~~TRINITY_DN1078_c0_g1_i1.p1  ORF type:complete len:464 (-),score=93.87 TRINITY_DN1078_c0_g1_i1:350-1741(-)
MSYGFSFPFGGFGDFGQTAYQQQQQASARKDVDTTKLYKLLGIEKSATTADIKKAFRKLAMTHHPDKGGDPEKFKEISKAYEILGSEEKRKIYDEQGLEAAEQSGGSSGGPSAATDIFDIFGGDMGGRAQRQRRGDDVTFPLKVSLEELFNGMTKKLRLTKNIICNECKGKGGNSSSDQTCSVCHGRGVKVVTRQFGHMIQQTQSTCDRCGGEGTYIPEKDRCKTCKGAKVVKEKKTLEVTVSKGMSHGQRITFSREGDQAPNTTPGDVVVILQQKDHSTFRREGVNLFMKKTLSLREALCGFTFDIKQLDGRTLRVKSDENEIYSPRLFKVIREEGMPYVKNPYNRGNLYIEIDVEFPKPNQLDRKARLLLASVLPASPVSNAQEKKEEKKPSSSMDTEDISKSDSASSSSISSTTSTVEDVSLETVDIEQERKKFEEQRKESYEEDERSSGQPRVQTCRTQ